jgi:hypothetical protein
MIRSEKIIWLFFAATSCQLALQHPSFLLLAGESPREESLKDYQIKYSGATKAQFARTVREIVSADNVILTFLVGLGFPFTLTYLVALGILLARLASMAFSSLRRVCSSIPWCSFSLWPRPWCISNSLMGYCFPKTVGFSTCSWALFLPGACLRPPAGIRAWKSLSCVRIRRLNNFD